MNMFTHIIDFFTHFSVKKNTDDKQYIFFYDNIIDTSKTAAKLYGRETSVPVQQNNCYKKQHFKGKSLHSVSASFLRTSHPEK